MNEGKIESKIREHLELIHKSGSCYAMFGSGSWRCKLASIAKAEKNDEDCIPIREISSSMSSETRKILLKTDTFQVQMRTEIHNLPARVLDHSENPTELRTEIYRVPRPEGIMFFRPLHDMQKDFETSDFQENSMFTEFFGLCVKKEIKCP